MARDNVVRKDNEQWTSVISSKKKLLDLNLKQVWEYRDLILLFIKRDFITYYKQTILGPLWYLVQPIISSIMYMFIFGNLANIGTDGTPQILFYFSGTMLWTFFSDGFLAASNVFTNNKAVFSKVYFPRLTAPIASTAGFVIKLLIQFALLMCLFIFYMIKGAPVHFSLMMLYFPLIILWIGVLSTGLGMIISSITTKYRDIALVLTHLVSLLMYATPVVYPLSEVPSSMKAIICANPVSAPIEFFRVCFFGAGNVPLDMLLESIGITLLCLFLGLILFNRNERTFVDVI